MTQAVALLTLPVSGSNLGRSTGWLSPASNTPK